MQSHNGVLPVSSGLEALALYVIPHSDRLAYVWCHAPSKAALVAVEIADARVTILERKKLFHPGRTLEVLLVSGADLRDGVLCTLTFESDDVSPYALEARARLARWEDDSTRRALRLIANRFDAQSEYPGVLERYCDFVSTWEAPGRIAASFTDGHLLELEICQIEDPAQAYAVAPNGLRQLGLQPVFTSEDRTVAWLAGDLPDAIFLDLSGELARISLQTSSARTSVIQRLRGTAEAAALIESLHSIIENPSAALRDWIRDFCPSRCSVWLDSCRLDLAGAARIPNGHSVAFIGSTGAEVGIDDLRVQAFGCRETVSHEVFRRDSDLPTTEGWNSQLILQIRDSNPHAGLHRIAGLLNGTPFSAWIGESEFHDSEISEQAQAFAPVARVCETVFPDIIHPIAAAVATNLFPRLSDRTCFGNSMQDPAAEIAVFGCEDLEALQRTILAVSLTCRHIPVRVLLSAFREEAFHSMVRICEAWSDLYSVSLEISCFTSKTSEADVIATRSGRRVPTVVCRAGSVPRRPDWLTSVLMRCQRDQRGLLIGLSHGIERTGAEGVLRPWLEDFASESVTLNRHQQLGAAVFTPSFQGRGASAYRMFGWEAVVCEQAIGACIAGEDTLNAAELNFAQTAIFPGHDEFRQKLDAYSLQRIAETCFQVEQGAREFGRRKVV